MTCDAGGNNAHTYSVARDDENGFHAVLLVIE